VQTAEQAIRRIAANQSDKGLAQGVGELTGGMAEVDLRGLGTTKTLVLLNGRQLSNHAYDGGAVDLHAIPMSLVDRIEVLREGASAIYGSGAIAGVVNFILRRDLQGVELAVGGEQPQQAGGATANV
jgi:iron complex outermembrane receptor protein